MEWKDQYKHPKWQKKRLEALEAAEFCCQRCYDSESQLQVHHKQYIKGRKIWEYSVSELSVLCDSCHEEVHSTKDALSQIILRIGSEGIEEVTALIASFVSDVDGPCSADCSDILEHLESPFGESLGLVAAAISNKHIGIAGIFEFAEKIKTAKPGDTVSLHFNKIDHSKRENGN